MSQDRESVGVSGLQVLEEWFLPRLAASTSATRCGLTAADDEARANLDETLPYIHDLPVSKTFVAILHYWKAFFYIALVIYVVPLEA